MLLYTQHLLLETLEQRCCPLQSVAEGRSNNSGNLLLGPFMRYIDLANENSNCPPTHLSSDPKGVVIATLARDARAVAQAPASSRLPASACAVANFLRKRASKSIAKAKGYNPKRIQPEEFDMGMEAMQPLRPKPRPKRLQQINLAMLFLHVIGYSDTLLLLPDRLQMKALWGVAKDWPPSSLRLRQSWATSASPSADGTETCDASSVLRGDGPCARRVLEQCADAIAQQGQPFP